MLPGSGSNRKNLPTRGPSSLRAAVRPSEERGGELQGSRLAHRVRSPGLGRPWPGCHPPSLRPEERRAARARAWGLAGSSRVSLDHRSSCSSSSEPEGPWRTSSYHLLVSVFIWMRPWWRSWGGRRASPCQWGQGQAQGQGREGQLLCASCEETAGRTHGQLQSADGEQAEIFLCEQEVTEGLTQNRRRRQDGAMLKKKKQNLASGIRSSWALLSALPRTGCVNREGQCTSLGLSLPGYQGRQLTASATWAGGRRK